MDQPLHTSTPATPPARLPRPRFRVDEMTVLLRRTAPSGVRMELRPARQVTAAQEVVLPAFDGWVAGGELLVRCAGVCEEPFSAGLELDGVRLCEPVPAHLPEVPPDEGSAPSVRPFSIDLAVPLSLLDRGPGTARTLSLLVRHPVRSVPIVHLRLPAIPAEGPAIAALDLQDVTDTLLVDAPERRLFDLQNPEEGLWIGTGRFRLRLLAEWTEASPAHYALDGRPSQVTHRFHRAGDASDVVVEDPGRRGVLLGRYTTTELTLDTSHPELGTIPEEGRDIPLDVVAVHALAFNEPAARPGGQPQQHAVVCAWRADLPVRLRDPRPLLRTFQRLSAVGIDFGTTATVAALYQKGYRSLLRLGTSSAASAKPAENPAYLLIEDHERLWTEMARVERRGEDGALPPRFPDLIRVIRGSHAAYEALAHFPSAVVGELKSLPERVIGLDQSPQFRDRERQRDFLLDEARVRALVRAYAYLLGRAINRPGQDVYLQYRLTHPAKFDERARGILEEEIRQGLLLSIPEGIPAEEVSVSMSASEPEAFAAEVCPELAAHPALEPLIERLGELRFAVFDFGGGTLDIACGRFRPATPEEQEQHGSSTVIETLQTGGDDHLGGDYLTHELTWLTHQSAQVLPEMEHKEVPMMRPQTVPPNNLANKPHLYKRSLAARQNRYRFERELGLEAVKHGPEASPRKAPGLVAARLDGSEVPVTSLGGDLEPLAGELRNHLRARIREGVKLMKNMLAVAPYGDPPGGGGDGGFLDQGVVILLAGNSSRSRYVERALADELGIQDLKVWRPDSTDPFSQVVLYETPPRTERGVSIVGVTPKTAVSLGALKIANHEVLLVRRSQGFSYFLGDLRGFPPKFRAIVPMGTKVSDPAVLGDHYIDFGRWDAKTPLRAAKEYEPSKMTSSDPRLMMVPTGLPPGAVGRLYVCVSSPDEIVLHLEREGQEPARSQVSLGKLTR
ncbi:hypothetical protein [Chondromyces apiculatus]|uniref:Uncharacterized protein n=1 Tax=Chondromyces apiculatus DSM 436 TaxID=1192034 RepID=A0A017SVN9_9BACT|nr:hypothetical protein [Chondromyces apiculatus]EYF00670.1 Hypothetical protein CAP_0361 [Chondromyces apiculatus DSM 436]